MSAQVVRLTNFSISYAAPEAAREPTKEEYEEMRLMTTAYFETFFRNYYDKHPTTTRNKNVTFLKIGQSALNTPLYGTAAEKAPPRFNIHVNFAFLELTYNADSVLPETLKAFEIVKSSITADYITDHVSKMTDTPFESTNEVYFAVNEIVVPRTGGGGGGST